MSKNVKMNRKRFIKLTAGEFGLQTRELTDAVMGMVNVHKRKHEKSQSEAHKGAKKGERKVAYWRPCSWRLRRFLRAGHGSRRPVWQTARTCGTARKKTAGRRKTSGRK